MKNIFLTITLVLGLGAMSAQVAIDREDVRGSAILDFPIDAENTKGGILLPRLLNTVNVANAAAGSLAYNQAKKQVEYYNGSEWVRLSHPYNGFAVYTNPDFAELNAEGVAITTGFTIGGMETPDSVLSLNASDKAMVLPNVADVTQLPSPQAGTIVYDRNSQSLAIYNGQVWSFWN
ncbi:hypothetical protein NLM59_00235 [Weeksellaceae bacterium KMM 9724]|uniref:hypothetical protein n=1 Tax=Profundicola chukchiensis TaxID=2961959 RepID=UPI00243E2E60|nr:hypothetical protein [Profundicola chukchiensis]MDG4949338.1 hypothetical protein [Profundicola chukchiensis]